MQLVSTQRKIEKKKKTFSDVIARLHIYARCPRLFREYGAQKFVEVSRRAYQMNNMKIRRRFTCVLVFRARRPFNLNRICSSLCYLRCCHIAVRFQSIRIKTVCVAHSYAQISHETIQLERK